MTSFADKLLAASEDDSLSPAELRAWMRRAALLLSEAEIEAQYLDLIRDMNEAAQEPLAVNDVLKDWLIAHGQIPLEPIDEDTETKGSA